MVTPKVRQKHATAVYRHLFVAIQASVLTFAGLLPSISDASPQCLSITPSQCLLKADQLSLRAQIDERGRIVIVFGNSPAELQTGDAYVVVQDDLQRLEEDESYTPNETAQLKNELATFDGSVYSLPAVEDLKLALGFPSTSAIGPRDYVDLVHVHMQLVLSISAITAGYLSDLMGLTLMTETPVVADPQDASPQIPSADPIVLTPNRN